MFPQYFQLPVMQTVNDVSYIKESLRRCFWVEIQKSYNFHFPERFPSHFFGRRVLCFLHRDATWQQIPIHTYRTVLQQCWEPAVLLEFTSVG